MCQFEFIEPKSLFQTTKKAVWCEHRQYDGLGQERALIRCKLVVVVVVVGVYTVVGWVTWTT